MRLINKGIPTRVPIVVSYQNSGSDLLWFDHFVCLLKLTSGIGEWEPMGWRRCLWKKSSLALLGRPHLSASTSDTLNITASAFILAYLHVTFHGNCVPPDDSLPSVAWDQLVKTFISWLSREKQFPEPKTRCREKDGFGACDFLYADSLPNECITVDVKKWRAIHDFTTLRK